MALVLRTLACTYPAGHRIAPHAHRWAQLIYAASGVMRVRAGGTMWIVPPARAVWAPAGQSHEIDARGAFAMRTLYVAPDLAAPLSGGCRAIEVSPLLRELILHAVATGLLDDAAPDQARLVGVIVDRLAAAPDLPLSLPWPADPRARRLADRLRDDPACDLRLAELARISGASVRTLQRLFLEETGLNLSQWRQRLRLLHGASLLGEGASVTQAGLASGYAGTSAFIAAFRRQFGMTPAQMR